MTAQLRVNAALSLLVALALPASAGADTASTIDAARAPNGLFWDASTRTLYIADENPGDVISWKDGGAAPTTTALPAGSKRGLGQVLRLADGTVVVSRIGHGDSGAVIVIPPKGAAQAVAGVDATRRRIGLAPAPDGVYSAWFTKQGDKEVGGVSLVNLHGGEKDVLSTGLAKPVGLAVSGEFLYVSDQSAGAILRCPARSCTKLDPVAKLAAPDLLAAGPGGSVLAASGSGGVTLVCPDGTTKPLAPANGATRGVAYDIAGRIFFVERGPDKPMLKVIPVQLGDRVCAAGH